MCGEVAAKIMRDRKQNAHQFATLRVGLLVDTTRCPPQAASVWRGMIVVRPSRRPLCGLLRMRFFLNAIKSLLILRSAQRARLEGRTTHMPDCNLGQDPASGA